MPDNSDLEGFDELIGWINRFPQASLPMAEKRMDRAAGIYQGVIAEYPQQTEANQPGRFNLRTHRPMGYYERGRGEWYPVMRAQTFGGKRLKSEGVRRLGKKKQAAFGVVGYKLRSTSETLGRRWYHRVYSLPGEIVGEIGNSASYMPEVNGFDQSRLMQARGWPNPESAEEEAMPGIKQEFGELLLDIKASFGGT